MPRSIFAIKLVHSVIFWILSGCVLTIVEGGSVTDIFLPKWAADRIFPVCGTTFVAALAVLLVRVLR